MHRFVKTLALLGALFLIPGWISPAPQQTRAKNAKDSKAGPASFGNTEAITEDELKVYDYFLASDQMEGRNLPSRGYDAAALYIASHLKEWGIKPGGSTTGTDGPLQSYLMPIELVSNQLDAAGMKLSLTMPPQAARGGRGGQGAPGGGVGGRGGAPAAPAAPRSFEYAKEWTLGGGAGGFGGGGRGGGAQQAADIANAQLVFVGNGYVINKTSTNPYEGIDVRGKIMVVAGLPQELAAAQAAAQAARGAGAGGRGAAGGRGGAPANPLGVEGTDFMTPQGYAAKNGAVGIIMVPNFQQLSSMSNPTPGGGGRGGGLNGPSYQVVKFQLVRPPSVPAITAGLDLTNALFQGEETLSAAQVFEGATANAKLKSFALNAEKKLSVRISVKSAFNHAENVIAVLEGGDPVLKNEYVVISAHLDHIGLMDPNDPRNNGDGVANGADDDASGCAAIMGIARAFQQGADKGIRPKRTMIFLWVAGEEKGLWGSQYFNQFPPIDISKVVLDLNMDMIGRSKTPGYVDPPTYKLAERNEVFVVGPNISSDDLDRTIEAVNAGYQKMNLNHFYDVTVADDKHDNLGPPARAPGGTPGQHIFSRSDHYNFAKMGIPIAFFTTGLHPDYHQVTDSPDKIDYRQMLAITRTIAALGWVVGNTATPPKLNAKLPEQLVNDMKTVKEQRWGKLTPVLPPLPKMPF
jgi:hypothetical protein